jgi:hypothetical protein
LFLLEYFILLFFLLRLVTIDYSWASIHSILGALNNETPETYAERVYKLAKNEITTDMNDNKSWLASCAAHTMKRFVTTFDLMKTKPNELVRCMAIFGFSLMLNSKDLNTIKAYFKLLCTIFLSKHKTEICKQAIAIIRLAVQDRPDSHRRLNKILKSVNKASIGDLTLILESLAREELDEEEEMVEEEDLDDEQFKTVLKDQEHAKTKADNTIKKASPFTAEFLNVEKAVRQSIELDEPLECELNEYYLPEFIEFLQFFYMPYAFIWASFTFQGK